MTNGFDLAGAAGAHDERMRRFGPIYSQPHVVDCVRLLHRNPWVAPAIKQALDAELVKRPELAIGLDGPLFDDGPASGVIEQGAPNVASPLDMGRER